MGSGPPTWLAATACDADPLHLESILLGHSTVPMRQPEPVFTHAERIDREHGSHWEDLTRDAAAGLCERHFAKSAADHGPRPGLYACWLEDAAMDPSLEIEGLVGFRGWVRCLPRSPELAVVDMLDRLEVAPWDRRPYLYRLLAGVHGWASHLRRWAWTKDREDPGLVREVLAVRLCLDAAVAALAPVSANGRGACSAPLPVEDERVRMTLQDAVEDAWARRLARDLARTPITRTDRPAVQAILCIDVRSEPLRRHLEAHDEGVETAGFAGFFGMAVRWTGAGGAEDRCPVLLRPSVQLHAPEVTPDGHAGSLLASLTKWPGSTFPAVETLGLGAAATLLRRAVRAVKPRTRDEESLPLQGLLERVTSLEARIETAAGMLAGLGLGRRLARLVLLLGHQGRSENNPHAAGLDCGACGGHGGAINARLAAALLNDPEVRRGLADHGAGLPEDTRFVSGVHETCSDEVRLLDVDAVPASHALELRRLREALDHACEATRRERATAMAIDPSAPGVRATLADRGGDWSQTRPEWCWLATRASSRPGASAPWASICRGAPSCTSTTRRLMATIPCSRSSSPPPWWWLRGSTCSTSPPRWTTVSSARATRCCTTASEPSGWWPGTAATCGRGCPCSRSSPPTVAGSTSRCGCRCSWRPRPSASTGCWRHSQASAT